MVPNINTTSSDSLFHVVTGAPAFAHAKADGVGGATILSEDLAGHAQEIARSLRSAGLAQDEPIVLFVSNRPEDLVGFLGVWAAGGVVVPIHADTPAKAATALIERVGARHAIRDLSLLSVGRNVPPERPLLRGAALIVFTSGTTGQPKGVVLGHAGLSWKLQILSRLIPMTERDTVALPLQLTFIFGVWVSLLALMSGAHLLLAPKLLATGVAPYERKVTVLAAVPTLLRTLCTTDGFGLPGLTQVLTGGEPYSARLADMLSTRVPGARVLDLFGLTETGSCDFCAMHPADIDMRATIGRETEGVACRIQHLPGSQLPDDVGELQIRSPAIMLGYLDDPTLTTDAFSDGYFRTGDLAVQDGSGLIQLVGRSKDIVSRGGNKISPLEIENLFQEHTDVAAALAFGMPDERLGERLHLMVVAQVPGLSEDQLRSWSKERLERYKIPDVFQFVEKLPVGRTGKADRSAARTATTLGQQS